MLVLKDKEQRMSPVCSAGSWPGGGGPQVLSGASGGGEAMLKALLLQPLPSHTEMLQIKLVTAIIRSVRAKVQC